MKTKLIIVGGFLGAGKTTLLQMAAKCLFARAKSVGLITNDQAEGLVDTNLLLKTTPLIKEISGSCFCCDYNGFIHVIEELSGNQVLDFIIAEPVGSCTDISATILQPLKHLMKTKILLSPFTVLADPLKLENILNGGNAGMHITAAYIYKKQLEEADAIMISKTDTISSERLKILNEKLKISFPGQHIFNMNFADKNKLRKWIEYVMNNNNSGNKILDIDYDVYAKGEAVLAWLNASILIHGNNVNWDIFLKEYFHNINILLNNAAIAHIKIIIECLHNVYTVANQTGDISTLQFRHKAGVSNIAQMMVNARVETDPQVLQEIIFEALAQTVSSNMFYEIEQCKTIKPGYPRPKHQYNYVIK